MGVKNDNFIFRRKHRRLTWISTVAIAPLFLTTLAAVVVWLFNTEMAQFLLIYITALPTWALGVIWIALPVVAVMLSLQAARRGTLHNLRSWNTFTYRLAGILLAAEIIFALVLNIL